jgi:hypothetical protein
MVAPRNGWFVSGTFDQYGHDGGGGVQALCRLGRLLLAGSDAEIVTTRARMVSSVGLNLALISSLPEFAVLLGSARTATQDRRCDRGSDRAAMSRPARSATTRTCAP